MKAIALLVPAAALLLSGCGVDPTRESSGSYKQRYYDQESYTYYGNRDRDGDGVPNRYDRRPDNPYRN